MNFTKDGPKWVRFSTFWLFWYAWALGVFKRSKMVQ